MNKIIQGNSLVELKQISDNSVDSIVTDPPYELGFMGKKWDNTGIAYNVELWRECLRVLKPGGHLLAFGGTRTYHRMAVAIEDAGFEVRDMIEWVYGSGFPKSLNIGKAVDKLQGNEREEIGLNPNARNGGGNVQIIQKRMDDVLTKGSSKYEGWGTALKPAHESICVAQKRFQSSSDCDILFVSLLNKLKIELCQYQSFAKIAEQTLKSNLKEQPQLNIAQWIAGKKTSLQEDLNVLTATLQSKSMEDLNLNIVLSWLNILADLYKLKSTYTTLTELKMTTELSILNSLEWASIFQSFTQAKSRQTDGQRANVYRAEVIFRGVQLKLSDIRMRFAQESVTSKEGETNFAPKHEPICMARKPLSKKTVAENCLKWGTGGINIDGCRVGFVSEEDKAESTGKNKHAEYNNSVVRNSAKNGIYHADKRPPENYEPQGRFPANLIHDNSEEVRERFPDSKSTANVRNNKASKNTSMSGDNLGHTSFGHNDSGNASRYFKSIIYQPKASKKDRGEGNNHATVKPVALMEYLIKMVTPAGGVVLDPFAGSGTTGVAAIKSGFQYLLIEMEAEHIEIIKARVKHAGNNEAALKRIETHKKQLKLF